MSPLPSFFEFTQLDEEKQFELTFKKGDYVGTSEGRGNRFVLYKLNNFFVEITYDMNILYLAVCKNEKIL